MKRWFATLPIHRKLTVLALGVSSVALVAAVVGLAVFDVARFRTSALDDAHALAQVMAQNLSAAIVFEDTDAATATLSSMRVRPTVVQACAYRVDGTLFAAFVRQGADGCATRPRETLTWDSVASAAAIDQNGRVVGSVVVERDLSDLGGRVIATAGAGIFVLLIGGAIALGLARSLQAIVLRPIVSLAQAARSIGRDQKFEMPAIDTPPDETRDLVRAFGEMVHRVGDANTALMETNKALRGEIEQRRKMQNEREVLLAREREASRLKDEFLAAVSHELRTPLNAILGWTQILQARPANGETLSKAIASLSRNAQAQSRVIEDLLDISRIITGKLQLSIAPLDLRSVIEAAVEGVETTAASREIELDVDLPDAPCKIHGDYDRLRQVTWNLLSNAIKFTPGGGLVRVCLTRANESFVLSVNDSGAGISPAFLSHVFERFRQADGSTTREQGGLGLGLAIVKDLVELHGGTVTAESPGPGRGSTFTIRLPQTAMSPPLTADAPAVSDIGPRLDGVSVMVVDDNADAIEVLGTALERVGATVRTESAGLAAVAAWTQEPADVLLCDLAMPGIDGFEVLRRIRAIDAAAGRATSALAVTAYASEDYRVRCSKAGFAGHLAKPYNINDVLRAVASAVTH